MESIGALLFPAILLGGFYLLLIRPQKARLRAVQRFQSELTAGQRVMTTAGIHGTVRTLDDELAGLEVAPGVTLTIARAALVRGVDEPGSSATLSSEELSVQSADTDDDTVA